MTLSFRTKLKGKPTFFVNKIIKGFWCTHVKDMEEWVKLENPSENRIDSLSNLQYGLLMIKSHTIRADKKDRWKPGTKIHFVINNRTKDRFQFGPVIPVVSVQKIEIKYFVKNNANKVSVKVDGKEADINYIASNDGFDSAGNFLDYFNKDFTGKIIHWTDLKY